ncbi:MAG: dihydroneopterin aldolase [Anaerolineaceae bacterium]|nr:dihydroneopterin aldolase [Anaerolineaceae bacterium]
MDHVIIKNLMIRGVIGISDHERKERQDIVVNVLMSADISKAGQSDNIEDCVNYRTVSKEIIKHVEERGRYTVEALASDIAEICLGHKGVTKAKVRVEKPGAVRFSESVGVEIVRRKTST